MTNLTKLKDLAERASALHGTPSLEHSAAITEFRSAANPQSILGLIERLEKAEQHWANENSNNMALIAEVERLRKVEALQKQVNEHYKRWYRECIDEPFDTWLKYDATHWIGEQDAAFQAWQYLHENKIWLMKERIEEHEQERDRLKAENEVLRQFAAEAYQVLGALDAPENVLDNASDAANGAPLRHETLLPFFAEGYEALRKDAERYRAIRQKDRGGVVVRDRTSHLFGESLDAAIDAALEGGGR
ncbi:MAG: hypothetical protein AB7E55_07705 [Pigmentiphaga sp.]